MITSQDTLVHLTIQINEMLDSFIIEYYDDNENKLADQDCQVCNGMGKYWTEEDCGGDYWRCDCVYPLATAYFIKLLIEHSETSAEQVIGVLSENNNLGS